MILMLVLDLTQMCDAGIWQVHVLCWQHFSTSKSIKTLWTLLKVYLNNQQPFDMIHQGNKERRHR